MQMILSSVLGICVACMSVCAAPGKSDSLSSIHSVVKDKINAQSGAWTKGSYREELQSNYQTSGDIHAARLRARDESAAIRHVDSLFGKGPVSLNDLIICALEFNRAIKAGRAAMLATKGEGLLSLSRFLPQVSYTYGEDVVDTASGHRTGYANQSIRISEKLLEFGRENDLSVALRGSQRRALFGYEETVSGAIFNIRTIFFSIVLRQQQINERRDLLKEYTERYNRMKEMEQSQRVLEVDVLTSRLNVLHEEARINALEKDMLRRKMDLMKQAGLTVSKTDFGLQGEIGLLNVDLEKCVVTALQRSITIAQARALVYEQQRVARRTWWNHAPDIDLKFGWQDSAVSAGVSIDKDNGTYGVSTFAQKYLQGPEYDSTTYFTDPLGGPKGKGWYINFTATLPVFQGLAALGSYKREKALLEQTVYQLQSTVDSVELNVRKAFQDMLEQQKELEILKETASISHERLKIQEKLKELGKISDNELETFRTQFFFDQSQYYDKEIELIYTQESLRYQMRWFEETL